MRSREPGVSGDERDRRRRGRSACRAFFPGPSRLFVVYWAEFALSPLNLSFHLLPTVKTPFG